MYKEFYLMQKEPFDSHPSPELFYKSSVHQTAWHYLLQGIKQHEPILVLAGEYGAGKTLLFLKLVRLLETKGRMPIVAVPSPTYNFVMILEKIVEKLLNISTGSIDTADESKLQQAVYEYFENTENRFPIYVIIDDAQEFSYSFINKLRLFASYNCNGFFPIRLIFFAHHSFLKMLRYKKLVALGQRIKRIYNLKPLNFEETKEYIYYRLIHSGATGTPIFNDEAVSIIQNVSEGNPRLINNVCDNCLLVAGEKRVNLIDQDVVYHAMEKGSLTGLKEIERPAHEPVAESVSYPPSFDAPQVPQNFIRNGDQSGNPGTGPSVYNQPSPAQFPPPARPHPPQGYYQHQVPFDHHAAPQAYTAQMPPAGNHHVEAEKREEKARILSASSGLWERYGKIILIVILGLVILFLGTYLYRQSNADKMYGSNSRLEKRVMKQVPTDTIEREHRISQLGARFDIKPERVASNSQRAGKGRLQKTNTFEPILLTGNL